MIDDLRLPDRFWSNVVPEPNTGCWLWLGGHCRGYGVFCFKGRQRYTHRVTYEAFVGAIPGDLQIDHVRTRGCASRSCCNPDHLETVTGLENMRRRAATLTHCPAGHPYDEANTYLRPDRDGRGCRACRRDQVASAIARRRASRRCVRCGAHLNESDNVSCSGCLVLVADYMRSARAKQKAQMHYDMPELAQERRKGARR